MLNKNTAFKIIILTTTLLSLELVLYIFWSVNFSVFDDSTAVNMDILETEGAKDPYRPKRGVFQFDKYTGYIGIDTLKRYEEFVSKKESDEVRILLLGDSVLDWGIGDVLKDKLESMSKESIKIKVLNSGVRGFDPKNEYLYLKYYGMRIEPDFIFYEIFPTNDKRFTDYFELPKGYVALRGRRQIPTIFPPYLVNLNYISKSIFYLYLNIDGFDSSSFLNSILSKIIEESRLKRVPLLVSMFPDFRESFEKKNHEDQVDLKKRLLGAGLDNKQHYIDLLPFINEMGLNRYSYMGGAHPGGENISELVDHLSIKIIEKIKALPEHKKSKNLLRWASGL